MLVAVLLPCSSFLKPQPLTLTVRVILYSCFMAGLLQNSDLCVECRLSERQVDWDFDRNVAAGECLHGTGGLSYWRFEHTNTEQCARVKKGGLKEGQRQRVRPWCMTVAVFAAHTVPLCALSLAFQPLAFPLSSPSLYLSRQMCVCLPLSCTVGVSSGTISI